MLRIRVDSKCWTPRGRRQRNGFLGAAFFRYTAKSIERIKHNLFALARPFLQKHGTLSLAHSRTTCGIDRMDSDVAGLEATLALLEALLPDASRCGSQIVLACRAIETHFIADIGIAAAMVDNKRWTVGYAIIVLVMLFMACLTVCLCIKIYDEDKKRAKSPPKSTKAINTGNATAVGVVVVPNAGATGTTHTDDGGRGVASTLLPHPHFGGSAGNDGGERE